MEIKKYITKISEKKDVEDMRKLGLMLEGALCNLKEYNLDVFRGYKSELYEMAYGKVITPETAEKWVSSMNPKAKWTMEETTAVKKDDTIRDVDFYVVMNMMYSDYHESIGDNTDMYISLATEWLKDEDIGQDKLYNYWKYVAKLD